MSRDRERANRHKDARVGATTRGMASANPTSPELPRSPETDSVSETAPLDISSVLNNSDLSVCSVVPDHSLSCDTTGIDSTKENSLDLNDFSTSIASEDRLDTCNYKEQNHSESRSHSDSDSDDMPPVPLLPPMADPTNISRKFRCLQPNCSYGGTDKRYEVCDGRIILTTLDPLILFF